MIKVLRTPPQVHFAKVDEMCATLQHIMFRMNGYIACYLQIMLEAEMNGLSAE